MCAETARKNVPAEVVPDSRCQGQEEPVARRMPMGLSRAGFSFYKVLHKVESFTCRAWCSALSAHPYSASVGDKGVEISAAKIRSPGKRLKLS